MSCLTFIYNIVLAFAYIHVINKLTKCVTIYRSPSIHDVDTWSILSWNYHCYTGTTCNHPAVYFYSNLEWLWSCPYPMVVDIVMNFLVFTVGYRVIGGWVVFLCSFYVGICGEWWWEFWWYQATVVVRFLDFNFCFFLFVCLFSFDAVFQPH